VAEVAHEPLVREIRLTWWAEALDEVFAARPPRRHPVVEALASAIRRRDLPRAPLDALIDARLSAIDGPALADEAAVHDDIEATAGALMRLAVSALEPASSGSQVIAPAARAWGLAGLARLRRAGVDRLPQTWSDADVRARVRAAVAEARAAASSLPSTAFPALAYVALARPYAAGRAPSMLERQMRLVGAVLSGRL
jgi:phytoene synthase